MTTYNTGNPLGSSDPRDLYDNAKIIDEYTNSDNTTTTDRLGADRKTIAGMVGEFDADQSDRSQRFDTFIASSCYQFVGDYDTGIELTEYNQVVRDENGEFWRVAGSQSLPYTTTGAGLPEGSAMAPLGDAVLRQQLDGDLANGQGARLVRGAVIYVDTVDDLQALDTSDFPAGQQASVAEAGIFVWSGSSWAPKGAETITIRVPSDYPDWQEAFDAVASLPHSGGGGGAEILIESGHVLQSGLYVGAGDYSHITITSEDSEVPISESFEAVFSKAGVPGNTIPRCVVVDYGKSPIFDALVNGENYRELAASGEFEFVPLGGLMVSSGGHADVNRDKGFINFAGQGLYVRDSASISARGSKWQNSGSNGAQITGNSRGEVTSSDFSGAIWNVPDPSDALTRAAVSVSRGSFASLQSINADNSARTGIDARRSVIHAGGATARNCERSGLCARLGSVIFASGIDLGEDGNIELRTEGGVVFLGDSSIYSVIRTASPSREWSPNQLTPYGIVFDGSKYDANAVYHPTAEENGEVFINSNGLMEKVLQVDVDTSTAGRQSFFAPGRSFLEGSPRVVSISSDGLSNAEIRDDFSKMYAGMSDDSQTFSIRLTEPGSGGVIPIQVKITGRAF